MLKIKNIVSYNDLDSSLYMNDYNVYATPNGLTFMLMKDKCNSYGNPVYRLFLQYEEAEKVKATKKTGVTYNKNKESFAIYSYNIGDDLEKLFNKCGIETGLTSYKY